MDLQEEANMHNRRMNIKKEEHGRIMAKGKMMNDEIIAKIQDTKSEILDAGFENTQLSAHIQSQK